MIVGKTRKKGFCPLPFCNSKTETQHEVILKSFTEDFKWYADWQNLGWNNTCECGKWSNRRHGGFAGHKKIFYILWIGYCTADCTNEEMYKCLACKICKKDCKDNCVRCDGCLEWLHLMCTKGHIKKEKRFFFWKFCTK